MPRDFPIALPGRVAPDDPGVFGRGAVEARHIDALATVEGVVAGAAVQGVVAQPAAQQVVAFAAVEAVVAIAADQRVIAEDAQQRVGSVIAADQVVAGVASGVDGCCTCQAQVLDVGQRGQVIGDGGLDAVAALAGEFGHHVVLGVDHIAVVAGAALEGVAAQPAVQRVVAERSEQLVGRVVADHQVVGAVARGVDGGLTAQGDVLDIRRQAVAQGGQDGVDALAGQLDDHVAHAVDEVAVVAGAADHGVLKQTTVEGVVARGPQQAVLPAESEQQVGLAVTRDHVACARAEHVLDVGEQVALRVAAAVQVPRQVDRDRGRGTAVIHAVAPAAAVDPVRAGIADQQVVAGATAQCIGVGAARQAVIAQAANDDVGAGAAEQAVGIGRALLRHRGSEVAPEDDIAVASVLPDRIARVGVRRADQQVVEAVAIEVAARGHPEPRAVRSLACDREAADAGGHVGQENLGGKATDLAEQHVVGVADAVLADDQVVDAVAIDVAGRVDRRAAEFTGVLAVDHEAVAAVDQVGHVDVGRKAQRVAVDHIGVAGVGHRVASAVGIAGRDHQVGDAVGVQIASQAHIGAELVAAVLTVEHEAATALRHLAQADAGAGRPGAAVHHVGVAIQVGRHGGETGAEGHVGHAVVVEVSCRSEERIVPAQPDFVLHAKATNASGYIGQADAGAKAAALAVNHVAVALALVEGREQQVVEAVAIDVAVLPDEAAVWVLDMEAAAAQGDLRQIDGCAKTTGMAEDNVRVGQVMPVSGAIAAYEQVGEAITIDVSGCAGARTGTVDHEAAIAQCDLAHVGRGVEAAGLAEHHIALAIVEGGE